MSLESLDKIVKAGVKLTPMMDQYYAIKKNHPETLLLFRMGDFYEVFFEDAQKTSRMLNITLTHRGKLGDFPIPMAGIPHHAASTYIDRLTGMGEKVAICEQTQNPKEAKGIVKRAVTQVVSPGMPFDFERAESKVNHYMAAGQYENGLYSLVCIDFTTGEFFGHQFDNAQDFLERYRLIAPKELIAGLGQWDESLPQIEALNKEMGTITTCLSEEYFSPKFTEIYTEKLVPTFKRDKIIALHNEILSPIGALAYYICSTQDRESYVHIHPFQLISDSKRMKVSQPTLSGLEILPKTKERYRESLLGFFDKTKTALGSRALKSLFLNPLLDLNEVQDRQDTVAYLLEKHEERESLRSQLSLVRDLERVMAKVSTGKATASDLINTAQSIEVAEQLNPLTKKLPKNVLAPITKKAEEKLISLAKDIRKTLNDEVGASLEKGNLIKQGSDKQRDKLAKLSNNASDELLKLEQRYKEQTGIQKLRVKFNNVAGYFIEVSKGQADKVPDGFMRRQTLVNSERYTTDELNEFEKDIFSAKEKLERLEREIFKKLSLQVSSLSSEIRLLGKNLGLLDVFQSLATTAWEEELTRPQIQPDQKIMQLEGAWHPLIKSVIRDQFVSHDLTLDKDIYFGLITGPNMAGKTTVMREVAIVQLLTQIGSFVPAKKAKVGLCDFLFSRLGASDDILKGQSTFMVEMAETAEILRHATDRSLIILDEVGRGTSTYDGLSIAWALVEHFVHKTKALTLFATHYHELIDVVDELVHAKNLTVQTQNKKGEVQFLYKLIEQGASQSFGLYVAKLAGLPQEVLGRSRELLKNLESENNSNNKRPVDLDYPTGTQLSFFGPAEVSPPTPEYLNQVETDLKDLDINRMTPIEAIQKLQELRGRLPLQ